MENYATLQKPLTAGKSRKIISFNRLYNRYKYDAKKRSLEFNLTRAQFLQITSAPCVYCGTEPQQTISRYRDELAYKFNGVDRKDNAVGYEMDNCVACCYVCNRAKLTMQYDEYILYLDRLVAYRSEHVSRDTNVQQI